MLCRYFFCNVDAELFVRWMGVVHPYCRDHASSLLREAGSGEHGPLDGDLRGEYEVRAVLES